MSQSNFVTFLKEKAWPVLISLTIPAVFAPWVVILFGALIPYTSALRESDRLITQGFVEWFGTAYSFFLALALVNVWSQFETVDREFDRELDAVSTLLQTIKYTGVSDQRKRRELGKFKSKVEREIKNYVKHVIGNYRFEHQVFDQRRKGDRILERIGEQISLLTSQETVPEPFINQLFHSLNEAMDVRGDRIAHSKPYTPPIIQVMAFVTSVVWLLSFLGLVIVDPRVIIILVGSAAFVIIMVLVIFVDLGEPFGGIWKINAHSWREFHDTLEHDADPHVIFIYALRNTIWGYVRFLTGYDTCHLHDIAHSGLFRAPWKEFQARLKHPRKAQEDHPVQSFEYHCNELEFYGVDNLGMDYPVVLLKRGDDQRVVMDSQQITACPDLAHFEEVFNEKLKKYIDWF